MNVTLSLGSPSVRIPKEERNFCRSSSLPPRNSVRPPTPTEVKTDLSPPAIRRATVTATVSAITAKNLTVDALTEQINMIKPSGI